MKVASLYVDRFTNQVGWLMSQWALSPWECSGRGGMPAHEEEPLPSEDMSEYPSPLLLCTQACLSQGWLGKNCTQFTEKMLLPSACLQSSLTSSHKLLRTLLFGLNKIDHIFRLYYFFFSGGISEFLLGRRSCQGKQQQMKSEDGNSLYTQDLHRMWYRRHFNLWFPAQKCQMLFHSI